MNQEPKQAVVPVELMQRVVSLMEAAVGSGMVAHYEDGTETPNRKLYKEVLELIAAAPPQQQGEPVAYLLRIDCEGDQYIHQPCRNMDEVMNAIKQYLAPDSSEDFVHFVRHIENEDNWTGDCCEYREYEIGSWTLYKLNCQLYTSSPSYDQGFAEAIEAAKSICDEVTSCQMAEWSSPKARRLDADEIKERIQQLKPPTDTITMSMGNPDE